MNNDNANLRQHKVLLIYTGGTIGMGRNPQTGALEPLNFEHLIANLPEFAYLKTDVDTYQFTPPIDSSDISLRRWAYLARHRHYGLHSKCLVVYAREPYEACNTYWLTVAYWSAAYRRQGESGNKY